MVVALPGELLLILTYFFSDGCFHFFKASVSEARTIKQLF